MQVSFDVLIDPPAYNYIKILQVKLYEKFHAKAAIKLEPHLTLKYAFEVADLDAIKNYFDDLVNQTKKFDVILNNISSFANSVVFIDVATNETLKTLHLKILKDLSEKFSIEPSEFEGEKLHFHSTLAYKDVSEETIMKIKDYLKNQTPNFTFKVNRLGMYLLLDSTQDWFIYRIGNLP